MTLSPGTYHCLSIWQPWAWAIFHGKGIENRHWHTNYRGKLLIHASKTTQDIEPVRKLLALDFKIEVPLGELVFGAILGTAEICACTWSKVRSPCGWGAPNAYHWHLRNQVLFDQPIPWRGQQQIFHVRIDFPHVEKLLL